MSHFAVHLKLIHYFKSMIIQRKIIKNNKFGSRRVCKIELPYDPAIPLLGIHTEESRFERDTPMFIAALFIVAKTWKQPKCPLTEERIKRWGIYIL